MKLSAVLLVSCLLLSLAIARAQEGNKEQMEQQAVKDQAEKLERASHLPPGTVTAYDLPYVDGMTPGTRPGSIQNLDLYVPAGNGPFPLVVYIHGGGWYSGNKEAFGATIAGKFIPAGFAVASLNYRLTFDAHFPAQLQDCNSAISWLRKHAGDHHLDPNRIGVIGHSAGAQIGAIMAGSGSTAQFADASEGSVQIQGAVCVSGPFDLDRVRGQWPPKSFLYLDYFDHQFFGAAYSQDLAQKASAVDYVHPGMPPILIIHGGKDNIVPIGLAHAFDDKLKAAGDDVTLDIIPDHGHTDVLFVSLDPALKFFQRIFGLASSP